MVDEVPLEHQLIFPPLPMLETKGRDGCCDFLSLARWRTSKVLPVWCCGSLGTPSLSPNRAQGLFPPLQPSLLFAAPTSHATGRRFGDVTLPHSKHPALGSQGGIWELWSLEETQPVQRREQWNGQLQTHPWQDTHWGHRASSYHGLAVSQAEKTPPAPKRASSLFRSHSHHQHNPCSARGWHWEPASPTYPSRDTVSVHEHLCAEVALKCSCVLQRGGGRCCHSHVTKPGGEKGGSASHPGLPQTAPEPTILGCRV